MIITVPPHVDSLMKDRATHMVDGPDEDVTAVYRALVEAWTEGVMYAWTMQDIKETSR